MYGSASIGCPSIWIPSNTTHVQMLNPVKNCQTILTLAFQGNGKWVDPVSTLICEGLLVWEWSQPGSAKDLAVIWHNFYDWRRCGWFLPCSPKKNRSSLIKGLELSYNALKEKISSLAFLTKAQTWNGSHLCGREAHHAFRTHILGFVCGAWASCFPWPRQGCRLKQDSSG